VKHPKILRYNLGLSSRLKRANVHIDAQFAVRKRPSSGLYAGANDEDDALVCDTLAPYHRVGSSAGRAADF
jgi:hypothetical protein